ncbi:hypothetical protein LCGC14_0326010 [marine sediment metagenome]|uniref:HTH cro/C1-type domain-containing protein n=1 Tax=marine sediment metagenome TaxID=412755 RepID=A0A0F9THX4_9ZZZZ
MSRKKKPQSIGQRIKAMRLAAELSQEALAEAAGIKQSYLSRIEGSDHDPQVRTLKKLAGALGVEVSELID